MFRHHTATLGWLSTLIVLGAAIAAGADEKRADEKQADGATAEGAKRRGYAAQVLDDEPVVYYRLNETDGPTLANAAGATSPGGASPGRFDARLHGGVKLGQAGPHPDATGHAFVDFAPDNRAARFGAAGGYLAIADPGSKSPLDFEKGDAITIEAWVDLQSIGGGNNLYIIGKGRTGRAGFPRHNQNWALRVREVGGSARVSLLFRGTRNRPESSADASQDWHRWTSSVGLTPGSGWHHVAVSYTFGQPKSVAGYLDGVRVKGTWDMGGATEAGPVVDDDEVWIGSSLGGSPSSTFQGAIDEVAVYRSTLDAKRIASRYRYKAPPLTEIEVPDGKVVVEVMEAVSGSRTWDFRRTPVTETFTQSHFGWVALPKKYTPRAVIADRKGPLLVRAAARIELPVGEHRLLVRGLGGTRLSIDDRVVATTRFLPPTGNAHQNVPDAPIEVAPGTRPLAPGQAEQLATFTSQGGEHLVVLEALVGERDRRQEIGGLAVSLEQSDGTFALLSPAGGPPIPLTEEAWHAYAARERARLAAFDAATRRSVGQAEAEYWKKRHAFARSHVDGLAPIEPPKVTGAWAAALHNPVDAFIGARLEEAELEPTKLADDLTFLRRLHLDVVGVAPSQAEIDRFLADPPDERRARVIDRLLDDSRWADPWVAYWQDVLAENPGILKPKLNNTGPFRYWLHESFLDNKRLDRMVSELVRMEGSTYYGGPAGFALATENDVPMAAKAHVLGQAFLGLEMKCARCHDAPFHDVTQEDLFSLSAMLKRSPQEVPKSSSVPLSGAELEDLIVKVVLKPGEKVAPRWPFAELAGGDEPLPPELMRNTDDPRARVAALMTTPGNERFARVLVNRLWARYLGLGLVEPVEDWQDAEASHAKLLDWLARELVASGYDLKHVARLVLGSHTYQRALDAERSDPSVGQAPSERLFAAPYRRRLSAEQVVDTLFAIAGKRLTAAPLTMDPEGVQPVGTFQNFGVPTRAWQFASLSNERDRPSLSFPQMQPIVDLLSTFGWRESRQNPVSRRDDEPTIQQPAVLANGLVTRRIAGLSDDNRLTDVAIGAESPGALVEALFLRILTRRPTDREKKLFVPVVSEGFADRVVATAERTRSGPRRTAVSWANHLSPEANKIKQEMERAARAGDPPTARLEPAWRARCEDVVWALLNSPEFVFVP